MAQQWESYSGLSLALQGRVLVAIGGIGVIGILALIPITRATGQDVLHRILYVLKHLVSLIFGR